MIIRWCSQKHTDWLNFPLTHSHTSLHGATKIYKTFLFILKFSADEGFDGTFPTNVVVRNNGSCLYVPPGIFKSTCKIDITWFPFDGKKVYISRRVFRAIVFYSVNKWKFNYCYFCVYFPSQTSVVKWNLDRGHMMDFR